MTSFRPILPFVLGVLLLVLTGRAENLRLVAWNLEAGNKWLDKPTAAQSVSNSVARNAAVLHELNPDILVLYDVPDWKACQQLAAALEPAKYSVHVCSAFPGAGKMPRTGRQVAILSKCSAYFSWSEDWQSRTQNGAGGFAFAALQIGTRRVGIFVVEAESGTEWGPGSPEALQWAKAVATFKQWANNKLDAALVAFRPQGTTDPAAVEAGLARTFVKTLTLPSGPANSFSASVPTDPATLPVVFFGQSPLLCDLDVAPANPMHAQARRVDPSLTLLHGVSFFSNPAVTWSAAAGTGLALAALVWTVAVLRRRVRRLAAPPAVALLGSGDPGVYSDTLVIAPRSATASSMRSPLSVRDEALPVVSIESDGATSTRAQTLRAHDSSSEAHRPLPESVKAGVISNLTQWLKTTFLRRVLSDRELLIQGQNQATAKAEAMDERLAGIELQIQKQTQVYEQLIQELTRELEASREENRALILAKIAQVKTEMQAARARLVRSEL